MPSSSVSSAAAAPRKPLSKSTLVRGLAADAVLFLLLVVLEGGRENREEEAGEHDEEHDAARRREPLGQAEEHAVGGLEPALQALGLARQRVGVLAVSFSLACFHSEE